MSAIDAVVGSYTARECHGVGTLFFSKFVQWMAVRTGIEGVSFGILITQLGLIVGVQLPPSEAHDLTAIQALMLVLAVTGLFAGQLVTERRLTEAVLRMHQESLAQQICPTYSHRATSQLYPTLTTWSLQQVGSYLCTPVCP